ncbi:uncharacterized protein CXQ87_001084 [Candidozyma duobushaemuli]|uniref:Inclusion body clearance protein IML2 n=2 Tax=Candidozyma TaxID=3303203 RepID=A0ABX8I0N5_9ASCO|nr:uncharacterized protein CXQ87_001084 [[Candida] duobushaemulonis]PVH18167.1 hypothetical protein CXQ87_001084 [[Candida] duobushaemulonis]QWU86731.1 hypothetical protein CA3LBN_000949 [[Candida] haemuloni]
MLKGFRKRASLLSLSSQPEETSEQHDRYHKVLRQVRDFEIALQAMDFLLDDRGDQGTDLLKTEVERHKKAHSKVPAAIFPLALGVMEFIEATLGFETEVMNRAHHTLSEAEEASLGHSKYNQKIHLSTSHIYPPGTEFQVTYAESTLLNALVMLLHENNGMMEQAKALFKLRRAYQILDATFKKIKESEGLFNHNLAKFRKQADSSSVSSVDLPGYDISSARSSSTSSSSSLPEDVKLMRDMEQIYKMRKARIEGTGVSSQVDLFAQSSSQSLSSKSSLPSFQDTGAQSSRPGTMSPPVAANAAFTRKNNESSSEEEAADNDEFSDAGDSFAVSNPTMNDYSGNRESLTPPTTQFESISINEGAKGSSAGSIVTGESSTCSSNAHLHVSTIDEFIHSGVQLCFGILQVVLSLIPPAIGKVLSIVGFKGDRETGLRMLWRTAITARNIHGELALLCLLVFYDGPIQFIDVGFQLPGHEDTNISDVLSISERSSISDEELTLIIRNPNLYTKQILAKARHLFPHNALWLLQEGRMLAAQNNIHKAIDLMQSFTDDPETKINMEQVEALLTFDRAMLYAFVHNYENAARDFLRLLEINSWSSAVYLFFAGSCYLEQWRMIQVGEVKYDTPEETKDKLAYFAKKADHYLKLAPTYVPGHGHNATKKKGGIGGSNKQMPFDKFVLRKTKCIEETHRKNPNLTYIECVETSLIHELVYFWNGYNRMTFEDLQISNRMLKFSAGEHAKITETFDEKMTRTFFESITLRQLGDVKAGLAQLDTEVISKYVVQDSANAPFKFTKMTYSPYLYPTALYEKAMFVWLLKSGDDSLRAINESVSWLRKAETTSDIGDYELSNRTSMRIKAASERLESLKDQL